MPCIQGTGCSYRYGYGCWSVICTTVGYLPAELFNCTGQSFSENFAPTDRSPVSSFMSFYLLTINKIWFLKETPVDVIILARKQMLVTKIFKFKFRFMLGSQAVCSFCTSKWLDQLVLLMQFHKKNASLHLFSEEQIRSKMEHFNATNPVSLIRSSVRCAIQNELQIHNNLTSRHQDNQQVAVATCKMESHSKDQGSSVHSML